MTVEIQSIDGLTVEVNVTSDNKGEAWTENSPYIEWGDGADNINYSVETGTYSHTYDNDGEYRIWYVGYTECGNDTDYVDVTLEEHIDFTISIDNDFTTPQTLVAGNEYEIRTYHSDTDLVGEGVSFVIVHEDGINPTTISEEEFVLSGDEELAYASCYFTPTSDLVDLETNLLCAAAWSTDDVSDTIDLTIEEEPCVPPEVTISLV